MAAADPMRAFGRVLAVGAVLAASGAWYGTAAQEPEMTFFRVATGGINGTYYPIGGLIANAISNPAGSRPCGEGGSCGVPNMIAAAVSSHGSVDNVEAIESGEVESGFVQADVVYDAYYAKGAFAGKPPLRKLRVLASLYPERLHLVVRRDSGIAGVADLRGKRVSLDEPGSGTLLMARLLLDAFGIAESDLTAVHLKPGPAATLMERGELDAFIIVAGTPTGVVGDLLSTGKAELAPVEGPAVEDLLREEPFLAHTPIPAGTYDGDQPTVPTIGVLAQWVVSSDVPDERVYAICWALWNDATRLLLDGGHPAGNQIRLENAIDGVGIPLHAGAERCYADLQRLEAAK